MIFITLISTAEDPPLGFISSLKQYVQLDDGFYQQRRAEIINEDDNFSCNRWKKAGKMQMSAEDRCKDHKYPLGSCIFKQTFAALWDVWDVSWRFLHAEGPVLWNANTRITF